MNKIDLNVAIDTLKDEICQLPPPKGGGLFLDSLVGNIRLVDSSPLPADLPPVACRDANDFESIFTT